MGHVISREHRRLRVRAEIEVKALELFVAQGFESTTVEQIAAACGISARTFFRYFASKSAVIFADLERDLAEIAALVSARPAHEGPYAALRAATLSFSDRLMERAGVVAMRSQLVRRDPHLTAIALNSSARWTELVALALADRGDRPLDEGLRVIATLGVAIMIAGLRDWGGAGDLREAVEVVFEGFEAEVAGRSMVATTASPSGGVRPGAP